MAISDPIRWSASSSNSPTSLSPSRLSPSSPLSIHSDNSLRSFPVLMSDKGRPLPKFGEWDVNDPASAEGFTVIFNKARDEKKTGGNPASPSSNQSNIRHGGFEATKSQRKKWLCCVQAPDVQS